MSQNKQAITTELPEAQISQPKRREGLLFLKSTLASAAGSVFSLASYMLLLPLLDFFDVSFLPNFFLFNLVAQNVSTASAYAPAVLVYAFILSSATGLTAGFFFNRKMVFHANSNAALSMFYNVLLILFSIIAAGFIGPWMVLLVSRIPGMPATLVQVFGKLLTMIVAIVWVYPANRFLIHRSGKEHVEEG